MVVFLGNVELRGENEDLIHLEVRFDVHVQDNEDELELLDLARSIFTMAYVSNLSLLSPGAEVREISVEPFRPQTPPQENDPEETVL